MGGGKVIARFMWSDVCDCVKLKTEGKRERIQLGLRDAKKEGGLESNALLRHTPSCEFYSQGDVEHKTEGDDGRECSRRGSDRLILFAMAAALQHRSDTVRPIVRIRWPWRNVAYSACRNNISQCHLYARPPRVHVIKVYTIEYPAMLLSALTAHPAVMYYFFQLGI